MARTARGAALTAQQRQVELALRADVLRDLVQLWRLVEPTNLAATIPRFVAAATVLIRARHRDAAGLAARYFEAFRLAEGLPGNVALLLAETPPAEVVAATVRGAGLSGIIDARRAGKSVQAAARNGLVKVSGSASSLVLRGARDTIVGMVGQDRRALGWQRVTSGGPCAFCALIASRGPAFKAERGAGFQAHDHCSCTAEPYYEGSAPLAANTRWRQLYDTAQEQARESGELRRGTSNDALNAFRRHLSGQAGE